MSRPLCFNDKFTGRFQERTLQAAIKKLLRRIETLECQKQALDYMVLNYARCRDDCPYPGSGANDKKIKPCTCGWWKAYSEVFKSMFNKVLTPPWEV